MNCLCCGKPIKETSVTEIETGWHSKCVKSFFGTQKFPHIEMSDEMLKMLAEESTNKGFTVPGVQKKISLHLSDEKNESPRLTFINYPSGYILKPQTEEYPALPEAEHLTMRMAEIVGISTVPYALVKLEENNLAYITKRIDRITNSGNTIQLAMEDFCQLDGRLTEDKYKGSYERGAKIITDYSSQSGLDMTEFYLRIVFSFAVGNSDMHLKNFSLVETEEKSGRYILSRAYDMLPVNTVNPADKEELALTMNGKKRNLNRNDFLKFADTCSVPRKVAEKLIAKVTDKEDLLIEECRKSYLPEELKDNLICLIQERMNRLAPVKVV